jgi:hypothetical protein
MAIQLSVDARNASLDSFETTTGTAAKLQIRTGAQPANCAASDTGTLLCELTLPSDWMAAASSGTKALAGSWTGTGAAGGTAAHFRIKNNAGSVTHMQGTVTATAGGGDMTLDNTSISVSQSVTITSFTLTAANA